MPTETSKRNKHDDDNEKKYHRNKRRSRSRSRSPKKNDREKRNERHIKEARIERSKWEEEQPLTKSIKQEPLSPRLAKREDRSHTRAGDSKDRASRNTDHYRQERERNDERRKERRKRDEDVDDSKFSYGKNIDVKKEPEAEDKAKPNFGLSGKLADDSNTYRGIVVKYNEPPEARIPKLKWRLYPFKGDEGLPILHVHRQSGYLIGRERKVADIPVDHPSCSKQHAVLQYRSVGYEREDGTKGRRTRPYIIDLGSANGTFVNNKQIEALRYVELFEKDTIKFGFSSRDYVILHDSVELDEDKNDEDKTEDE